jgi:hypothetical protein
MDRVITFSSYVCGYRIDRCRSCAGTTLTSMNPKSQPRLTKDTTSAQLYASTFDNSWLNSPSPTTFAAEPIRPFQRRSTAAASSPVWRCRLHALEACRHPIQ